MLTMLLLCKGAPVLQAYAETYVMYTRVVARLNSAGGAFAKARRPQKRVHIVSDGRVY